MTELLDRPIWSALTTGWSLVAEGDARALRLDRSVGMFGAAADASPESLAALAALVPAEGELWLVERQPMPLPPGTRVKKEALAVQMVLDGLTPDERNPPSIVPLSDADGAEMYALAMLTEPGPYVRHTHRLGGFVGIRDGGKLVAMAGERMHMPGWGEVSAVCTHPGWRGRGYAGHLTRYVVRALEERGMTPFLHSYASNTGTIALYEALGFRVRTQMIATVIELI